MSPPSPYLPSQPHPLSHPSAQRRGRDSSAHPDQAPDAPGWMDRLKRWIGSTGDGSSRLASVPLPRTAGGEDDEAERARRRMRAARRARTAAPAAQESPERRVERMREDLRGLFSRVQGSRYVLRHLATLEHELKKKGEAVFDDLPLAVLQKAALQLESLVEPPVPVGVATLRSRLGLALLARERAVAPEEAPVAQTTLPLQLGPAASGSPPPAAHASVGLRRVGSTLPMPHALPPTMPMSPAAEAAARGRAGADTEPAVLVRERISSYIADGHIEVSEASVSDFEEAVTNWGLLRELPPLPQR